MTELDENSILSANNAFISYHKKNEASKSLNNAPRNPSGRTINSTSTLKIGVKRKILP